MAKFEGSIQEFHHYIGPRIRNAIQSLARKERKARGGVCEGYESKPSHKTDQILESAHIHGRKRRAIIEKILSCYSKQGLVRVNLESIEKKILEEHGPIADVFKFLCRKCHREYDNLARNNKPSPAKHASHTKLVPYSKSARVKLHFFPEDETIFKTLLIKNQKCYVLLRKADGAFEPVKEWNASRFRETSNLRGNIFTGYLRNWKQREIVEANFAIRKSDFDK